ncbi:MAG TPA: MdtA/MuxA family multidrug efflux RND transporter periplasmic adaptor subunit [Candidatus Acidoferrales bacterium]|nr:MdtA/MuxA family multidrug efflux RND transporter periplasmic adaptor subunit [Candidatus Acidoferrales bacterium]
MSGAKNRRWGLGLVGLGLAALIGYRVFTGGETRLLAAPTATGRPSAPPVPVVAAKVRQGDIPVYLNGLGTVTAFNTVMVKSRVDGQLDKIAFQEGQFVHSGDLLAEIDPRPFEVQLAQAEGQKARDTAQLNAAKVALDRYGELVGRDFIAKQQYDDQKGQVGQFEGAIRADQAAIDNAKLQLVYSRITAPISGRVGLRLVDVGNMVHPTDQNGLVVITQVQPIAVLFTLPEDTLQRVLVKLHSGDELPVEAYDRAGQKRIATGKLLTIDNQIDTNTGTTRLKGIFPNEDNTLFPNQFVNVRLLVDTLRGTLIVPTAAVQRGPQGTFVYVVKTDNTVDVRPVSIGATEGNDTALESGLAADEKVVVDGVDKLRAGSSVQMRGAEGPSASAKPPE